MRATHLETRSPELTVRVVIIQNLHFSAKFSWSLTFPFTDVLSLKPSEGPPVQNSKDFFVVQASMFMNFKQAF